MEREVGSARGGDVFIGIGWWWGQACRLVLWPQLLAVGGGWLCGGESGFGWMVKVRAAEYCRARQLYHSHGVVVCGSVRETSAIENSPLLETRGEGRLQQTSLVYLVNHSFFYQKC
jgi:hypothetical protein